MPAACLPIPEEGAAGPAAHADPGAHRRGRPLATRPQDDPPAPRDADGIGDGRRRAEGLSLRRPGEDHAIPRPGHLPHGRPGPESVLGVASPADRPSRGDPGRGPDAGRRGGRLDGRRVPTSVPRTVYDHQAREFARRFWPEQARDAELACVQWDFGISVRHEAVARTAIYLCNQQIYSPRQSRGGGPRWPLVTPGRPLRCVVFDDSLYKSPATSAWLASMQSRFDLRKRDDLVVPTIGLDMKPWDDHVRVYEFQPRPIGPVEQIATGTTVVQQHR